MRFCAWAGSSQHHVAHLGILFVFDTSFPSCSGSSGRIPAIESFRSWLSLA